MIRMPHVVVLNPLMLFDILFARFKNDYKVKALFLDADGVLWPDVGPGSVLRQSSFAKDKRRLIKSMKSKGYKVFVVSNQSYAARIQSFAWFSFLSYYLRFLYVMVFFKIDALSICFHHPVADNLRLRKHCPFRKPGFAGLLTLNSLLPISKEESILVGDRITDVVAGESYGISKLLLISGPQMFQWNENFAESESSVAEFYIIDDLFQLVNYVSY